MTPLNRFTALFALCVSPLAACQRQEASPEGQAQPPAPSANASAAAPVQASKEINPRLLRRFAPVRSSLDSPEHPLTEERIALGRMLYFEKRISLNKDLSCNSCHQLDAYGVDGEATSPGDKGQRGARNSPTVYHAAGYFTQFWDGRATDVEQQAKGPILNPIEMAFAKLKAFLRAARPRSFDHVVELVAIALRLFTPRECHNFIRHCGYRFATSF